MNKSNVYVERWIAGTIIAVLFVSLSIALQPRWVCSDIDCMNMEETEDFMERHCLINKDGTAPNYRACGIRYNYEERHYECRVGTHYNQRFSEILGHPSYSCENYQLAVSFTYDDVNCVYCERTDL